jgi:glucokinase
MAAHVLWTIGLDIGGTKLAGGLVRHPAGEVTHRRRVPTRPGRDAEGILADAVGMACDLAARVPPGEAFAGVGMGMPELVDLDGRLASGVTVDWRSASLADRFAGIGPVWVESDVRAAALAEARFGAGRRYRLMAYVTIGTGISYTLIQEGRPYRGARGNALLLASGPTSVRCPGCGTWARAVLEEVASGPGLLAAYNAGRPVPVARAEDVLAAVAQDDPDAVRVVRDSAEALGGGVGWLVNVLDPEAVVVGGGLGLAGGLYWETFVDAVRRHVWAEATRGLPIVRAELGADAGVIGAAVHARDRATGG